MGYEYRRREAESSGEIRNIWGNFVLDPATGLPKLHGPYFWHMNNKSYGSYLQLMRETLTLTDRGVRKPQSERHLKKIEYYPIYSKSSWDTIQESACYILFKAQEAGKYTP